MQKDKQPIMESNQKDTQEQVEHLDIVTLAIKDIHGRYIYNRALKISKALFLVTQHLKEGEYLKKELRQKGVDLSLKTFEIVKDGTTESDIEHVISILGSIHTVSDIAVSAQVLSNQSYTILKNQFVKFADELLAFKAKTSTILESEFVLDQSYLVEGLLKDNTSFRPAYNVQMHKSENASFAKSTSINETPVTSGVNSTFVQRNTHGTSTKLDTRSSVVGVSRSSATPSGVVSSKLSVISSGKNERQVLILDTIRQKGELSIKDLTDVIKGCSEKTIQRELIALVGAGDLLKTGERRWSRYSIAN